MPVFACSTGFQPGAYHSRNRGNPAPVLAFDDGVTHTDSEIFHKRRMDGSVNYRVGVEQQIGSGEMADGVAIWVGGDREKLRTNAMAGGRRVRGMLGGAM